MRVLRRIDLAAIIRFQNEGFDPRRAEACNQQWQLTRQHESSWKKFVLRWKHPVFQPRKNEVKKAVFLADHSQNDSRAHAFTLGERKHLLIVKRLRARDFFRQISSIPYRWLTFCPFFSRSSFSGPIDVSAASEIESAASLGGPSKKRRLQTAGHLSKEGASTSHFHQLLPSHVSSKQDEECHICSW